MEYLVFWLTRDGVKPTTKNIEEITNMKPPTYRKLKPQNVFKEAT